MSETATVTTITVTQQADYQFLVDFGGAIPALVADEPPPLGGGSGPAPDQILLAAIANCLSSSLLFALRKFKQDPAGITTTVSCTTDRNAQKRLRVQEVRVDIAFGADGTRLEHLDRVLSQFEDFCTVSQSIQTGIPITVTVTDGQGRRLK